MQEPPSLDLAPPTDLMGSSRLGKGLGRHLLGHVPGTTTSEHEPEHGIDVGLEELGQGVVRGVRKRRLSSPGRNLVHTP